AEEQIIALVNCTENVFNTISAAQLGGRKLYSFTNPVELYYSLDKQKFNLVAIISQNEVLAQGGIAFLEALRKRNIDVPFFLVSQQLSESTV
ncbi:hypothetical protein ABTA60_19490, partial [Acinetobacter baumannii]